MANREEIPSPTREAFDHLTAAGIVQIVQGLRPATDGSYPDDAEFLCRVGVPHPNIENLPALVDLRVVVPATFPLALVDVYPEDDAVRGFPHQDAETGKLCLQPSSNAPWDITRLKCYLEWAIEWLQDAAQGTLLAPGDPYELPDFSRRNLKLPLRTPLFFGESATSFRVWKPWIGRSGALTLKMLKAPRALVPVSFSLPGDAGVHEMAFAQTLLDAPVMRGRWLLLPDIRALRHRPAQNFGELELLCKGHKFTLYQEFYRAWREKNIGYDCGVVLIGFPIPHRIGDEPSEIHWQPLLINTSKQDKKLKERGNESQRRLFNRSVMHNSFGPNTPLPWGKSSNVSAERIFARGGHDDVLRTTETAVCGCGALGSVVCELLVRGGVSHLSMFDSDTVEIGNLCRHTLDGTDVGCSKASALERRLSTTNPLADIQGFCAGVPLLPANPKKPDGAYDRLLSADLFIDCTTDEGAFIWLNALARRQRRRLVSIFFNFGATVLTLCISGKHTSCAKVCRRLYQDIRDGCTPVSPCDWDPEPTSDEFIVPGAGCWHPTFPAVNSHVWMLAASAVDVLNHHLPQPLRSDGLGVLIRRNNVVDANTPTQPLVAIAWMKQYR